MKRRISQYFVYLFVLFFLHNKYSRNLSDKQQQIFIFFLPICRSAVTLLDLDELGLGHWAGAGFS